MIKHLDPPLLTYRPIWPPWKPKNNEKKFSKRLDCLSRDRTRYLPRATPLHWPLHYRATLFIMVKICIFISMTIFLILIKENEFYNIKTRLNLGLFSVKTFLQPSFALAATITFAKIWPRGQNIFEIVWTVKNYGSWVL